MSATYTKLKSGDWGIRVEGGSAPAPGAKIVVTKKSGETKTETVAAVVWSGNGIHLCAVATDGTPRAAVKCSSCGCSEAALRKPYEKMLTTKRYGVICSPCYKDAKDGYDD